MKKKIIHRTVVLTALIFGLIVLTTLFWISEPKPKSDQLGAKTALSSYPLPEFDQQLFQRNMNMAIDQPETSQIISAAIIPHHSVGGTMIANLLQTARNQGITRIIIVGPNHQDIGVNNILTTNSSWETPFGIVLNDAELTKKITDTKVVTLDNSVFKNEQSIYTLTPYIKTILPDVSISSIILKKKTTRDEEKKLAEVIAPMLNEKTLLIASVDFSHYLPLEIAEQKDKETIDAITKKDTSRLYEMNSDYLDSPASVSVLLNTMNILGKNKMEQVTHSNSDMLQGIKSNSTTSYFHLIFY